VLHSARAEDVKLGRVCVGSRIKGEGERAWSNKRPATHHSATYVYWTVVAEARRQ
jgi:hypothetical protein